MVHYVNGNYEVFMFNDGTKVRMGDCDEFKPEFPESIDVCITKSCNQLCPFCYEGCTPNGKCADLTKYNKFFNSLHSGTEVALNGNDMTTPDLDKTLRLLKERGVYANITVNQNQFLHPLILYKLGWYADRGLIHGVGVSYNHYDKYFLDMLKHFHNAVIHVIAGIVKMEDMELLKDKDLKVLVLGYKSNGRGESYKKEFSNEIDKNIKELSNSIGSIIEEGWFKVLSFDNLALKQLNVKDNAPLTNDKWGEMYMGDDGCFTFYVDLVDGVFAKNSTSNERYPIDGMTASEMFKIIRRESDMKKIQVRRGIFETNSSSTHVISISKNDNKFMDTLPSAVYFDAGEFGWGWTVYHSTQDKANYLYTAIVCNGLTKEYKPIITAILAKYGIEAEFAETVTKVNQYSQEEYEEFVDTFGYVDHSNEAIDFIKDVCSDEEKLMAYLFSTTSYVATGNDNEDSPDDFYPDEGKEDIYYYEKGN